MTDAERAKWPTWSPSSIVTPRISGLNYTESIDAMLQAGIRYAVGDNSRVDLAPKNEFHAFFAKAKVRIRLKMVMWKWHSVAINRGPLKETWAGIDYIIYVYTLPIYRRCVRPSLPPLCRWARMAALCLPISLSR